MARVLVLEDNWAFAASVAETLEEFGLGVDIAEDADRAISMFEETTYALVISDLFIEENGKLKNRGGVQFISWIKQLKGFDTPVIAMSGAFSNQLGNVFEQTAKTVGATAVIAKPFSPDELLDLVASLLAR